MESAGPATPPPVPAQNAAGAKPADGKADPAAPKAALVERKIIYTAHLDVIVKDLDEATREVERRRGSFKGRVAKSEARSDAGARRIATFTLEVPVDQFRGLVAALKDLGTPDRDSVDSQDVTEEYVDVQARIKNLRQQEDKLNELLQEKRKEEKLEDVIRLSDRIYEVRQVVERAEGRLKYLEARAAFSTVNLTLREIKDYQPPTAPTFGDRVGHTFRGSWESLVGLAEGVTLVAVALGAWLPLLVPTGLVGLVLVRKAWPVLNAPLSARPAPWPAEPSPPPADEPRAE
jgi:hypothetical protein